jgi:hypothetical protein
LLEDCRDPLQKLGVRPTYRRLCVLAAIGGLGGRDELSGSGSGPSNREIAAAAGIEDAGQTSKLLKRLQGLELIENTGLASHGKPNAWRLTAKGVMVRLELEAREWA